MLEPFRSRFNNEQFSPERYQSLQRRVEARTRSAVEFRICETPCFFPRALIEQLAETGRELTHQLIDSPTYMQRSDAAIPDRYRVPNDNPRPNFMTVDFGLVRNAAGELEPRLVELQAFPSVYGYQDVLTDEYIRTYQLDETLVSRLHGMSEAGYWQVLSRTILGNHAPENVILTEVEPALQKTRPDFNVYADRLGVRTVDITQVRREGNQLRYLRDGVWTPVARIFNRAIVDEMERKNITPGFDYRDDLDVEWAGQPNWYFRVSKFSLPYLDHPSVPPRRLPRRLVRRPAQEPARQSLATPAETPLLLCRQGNSVRTDRRRPRRHPRKRPQSLSPAAARPLRTGHHHPPRKDAGRDTNDVLLARRFQ